MARRGIEEADMKRTYVLDSETTVYQDERGSWTGDLCGGVFESEPLSEVEVIDLVKRHKPELMPEMFPMSGFHS